MSPLDKLSFWFMALPESTQDEFLALIRYYHPDERLAMAGTEECRRLFFEYMDSSCIERLDALKRVLYLTSLVDFCFAGKDTEAGWERQMDVVLAARSRALDEGRPLAFHDDFLDNYANKKAYWLQLAAEWNEFRSSEMSNIKLSDWYNLGRSDVF